MTRVLSGAVLIALVVGVVWFAPPIVFHTVAFGLLFLAVRELVDLARASGLHVPFWLSLCGAAIALAPFALSPNVERQAGLLLVALMAQLVAVAATQMAGWTGHQGVFATVSASLFPSLYLSLPLGAMIAIRDVAGPATLFLLMLTIMASDTAQYYAGRVAGRRPLAPAISPKKTVEGAIGGFVVGALVFAVAGSWWLERVPAALRVLIGLTLVASGIAGDLFESQLKRSAHIKDSSALIPGHGGVLDRIDALLFAAPLYYVVLQLV